MNREAGKGDDRRPESAPGLYAAGHEAIDWQATRTERQADQDAADALRAEKLERTQDKDDANKNP